MYGFFTEQVSWPILRSFDCNSVFTRLTIEKVSYKPGLDYLLECFLPCSFAPVNSSLLEILRNFFNWEGAPSPIPPHSLPVRLCKGILQWSSIHFRHPSMSIIYQFTNWREVKDAQTRRACEQAKIGRKIAAHPLKLRTTLRFRLRWLNRVMQDHEARASDLNRKLIFSFFLLFSSSKLLKHNKGPKFTVQQSPLISRLLVSN